MHPITRTGRILNLEGLENSTNKVTLGCKCEPQLKIDLAHEAKELEMSLSEYVAYLLEQRNDEAGVDSQTDFDKSEKELKGKIEKLRFFYEQPLIRNAFISYKGQNLTYKDSEGNKRWQKINKIEDVYTVLFAISKLN